MVIQIDRFNILNHKKNPQTIKTLKGVFITDHTKDQPVVYIDYGNNTDNEIIAEEIIRVLEEYVEETEGDG